MKFLKNLALITTIVLTSLFGTEYTVDKDNSMVTFKIRHAVVAKVEGKFNDFSGTYSYDVNSSTFSSFEAEAKMVTVDTDDKYRDEHLKFKLFDVEQYPVMTLKLVKQDGSSFFSDLTIKDVTKQVEFTISLVADSVNKFILSAEISREDFGLKFSDTAEMGGLAVGDTIEINILFAGV